MAENPVKILLVDDEASIRRLLRQRLSRESYQCLEAGTAAEAQDLLRAGDVSLVILDVKMPGKTGLEYLPELKARYPDTAVIMATATDDAETAIRCMKQGAYDYLIKPFKIEEVPLCVDRALENQRLRIENRDYQLNLEGKVKEQTVKIRESFLNSLKALVRALEAKDAYTSDHSRRVAELSASLAGEMGLAPEFVEKMKEAGLIHDIGKIGIKEAILSKPGRLTDDEYRDVRKHPEVAASILVMVAEDRELLEAIVHHHERYDGKGYPDGLAGENIPLGARILAVADAYDAMTSVRPYRKAMEVKAAHEELRRGIGTQFDPVIARVLLKFTQRMDVVLTGSSPD